jgi:hypothetical protein
MAAYFIDLDGTFFKHGTMEPVENNIRELSKTHQIIFVTARKEPNGNQDISLEKTIAYLNTLGFAYRIIGDVTSPRVLINDDGAYIVPHIRNAPVIVDDKRKNVHIITPFKRVENKEKITGLLRQLHIIWHPILSDKQTSFDEPWIAPIETASSPSDWQECYWKINQWIERQQIIDDDWYGFANDDDGYEPNVIDMVRTKNKKAVIISMKSGQHIPNDGHVPHSTATRFAAPENMAYDKLTLLQLFIRGSVLKSARFENDYGADGKMAEYLIKNFPGDIDYEPEYYGKFNLFQPGRWDDCFK